MHKRNRTKISTKLAKNMVKVLSLTAVLGLSFNVFASPINGTGNITPEVIFGDGNANGSWTGETVSGVEVALRGKLRYNAAGSPENTFNYDGDRTYTFDPTLSSIPANRSVFNFEYAVNVDTDASGNTLDDYSYLFEFDLDPTAGTDFVAFDIITLKTDNELGDSSTGNGDGIVDTANYASIFGNYSVAQNSQNRGFGYSGILDADAEGIFTYNLTVFDANGGALATSSIDIVVGNVPVPAPSALVTLFSGVFALAFISLRRRKKQLS
ncbi:PEP-CTERM sorting domain-containing protein [Paraglaciecola sp. 20A4]|uniref:PEP-CTERM sorting domain-containing protein n=1 Tax=Paraglaciecola sp. 20A4 TaxID=2687288 RepID=UPI00140D2C16|nr:PEP-CTERM sorting domain-containing protein [Paraglaciecola sp. 20A4]